jgi:hypothetical protein
MSITFFGTEVLLIHAKNVVKTTLYTIARAQTCGTGVIEYIHSRIFFPLTMKTHLIEENNLFPGTVLVTLQPT